MLGGRNVSSALGSIRGSHRFGKEMESVSRTPVDVLWVTGSLGSAHAAPFRLHPPQQQRHQ